MWPWIPAPLRALALGPAGCPGTAGPGESPSGLTLSGRALPFSIMEQWFFEHRARGRSLADRLAGGLWLACDLTVSRQTTDKARGSSPCPQGGGAPTPPDHSGMEGR